MDSKGNVWWTGGRRNTGKTFISKQIAKYFRERIVAPKRTIVFDHAGNAESYPESQQIDMSDLRIRLPQRANVRVESKDFHAFFEMCQKITNACILVDDGTHLFGGNLPEIVGIVAGQAKNNRLELIFQMHTISETAPRLLREANMFVLKETNDELPFKAACPDKNLFTRILFSDLKNENMNYEGNKKWATRIFDRFEEEILFQNLSEPDFEYAFEKKLSVYDYKRLIEMPNLKEL